MKLFFELFRGLRLQLSGVFGISLHYSYSFLVVLTECSYRKSSPSGIFSFLCNYSYMIQWFLNFKCHDYERIVLYGKSMQALID